MLYTSINFAMTLFALYLLVKMSKAVWSHQHADEELSRKTTQMDREVAAGWFDYMMVDTEFQFRNFLHNIPISEASKSRRGSSFIESNSSLSQDPESFYLD